jgi:sporulation protein YlmC with PRC-barrel domain
MKRSIKDILGYKVTTKDGTDGKCKDALFDNDSWTIRYLEVDFGTIFNDRKVLIPRFLLRDFHVSEDHMHLELTKEQIDNCPKPEDHLTVSRKYEEEIHKYYGIDYYWSQPYAMPVDPVAGASYPLRVPSQETVNEYELNTKLRSFNEIKGYTIHANDGKMGNIADLIIDDSDWRIVYAVVNSGNWLEWRRKVLLDIGWIDKISYENKEAQTYLPLDAIKNAPEYDPRASIDNQYENVLHRHYENDLIKSRT